MIIRMLTNVQGARKWVPGEIAFMPDAEAQALIDSGAAELSHTGASRPIRIRLIDPDFPDDRSPPAAALVPPSTADAAATESAKHPRITTPESHSLNKGRHV
jgi:hypothetical protein